MQKSNNNLAILLILLFIFTLTTASWMAFDAGWVMSKNEIQGTVLSEAKTIDAFALIDNKQRPFTLQNLKDKWTILFFGFSHCGDDCQTTMDTLTQVHALFSGHVTESPQVVFVSVDYERDTPEKLDEYLSSFSDEFVGVTGSADSLEKFAGNLDVHFKTAAMSSDNSGIDDYMVEHTSSLILVNPEAKVTAILSAPYRVADLHNDIMTIIED
jgi:protein SCO1/2